MKTNERHSKVYAVTYGVTFRERIDYSGIEYYPGVEYHFTALSDSGHKVDCSNQAYSDIHRRFGLTNLVGFLPLTADPAVKEVKEVVILSIQEGGES
jgi:hypothetical protein